jgi:hypothetical protein
MKTMKDVLVFLLQQQARSSDPGVHARANQLLDDVERTFRAFKRAEQETCVVHNVTAMSSEEVQNQRDIIGMIVQADGNMVEQDRVRTSMFPPAAFTSDRED